MSKEKRKGPRYVVDNDAFVVDTRPRTWLTVAAFESTEDANRVARLLNQGERAKAEVRRLNADHTDSEKALIDSVLRLLAEH